MTPLPQRVAIVGGGLAGLAAAAALASRKIPVDLFESRSFLGGRASSVVDKQSGELIDNCQHVTMGCCTNFADFCRRTGLEDCFRTVHSLLFLGPDGRRYDLRGSRWLPPPLHLARGLWGLRYLSAADRYRIARALWRLTWLSPDADSDRSMDQWLIEAGQSSQAIDGFWSVVLVSALSESLDRIAVPQARKVFVDGFMTNRRGFEVSVPRVPLGALYGEKLTEWLDCHGVKLHLGCRVRSLSLQEDAVQLHVNDEPRPFDVAIAAVPWHQCRALIAGEARLPESLNRIDQLESAPITSVHLWFDRPITDVDHAVMVGRLSQWMFRRESSADKDQEDSRGHYYQVVISASRNVEGRDRDAVVEEVAAELAALWPQAGAAKLLYARLITERRAVFSPLPGTSDLRPGQSTGDRRLFLAGDWTQTGWPATMEGAVRSGYLAAEELLAAWGEPARLVQPDLPRQGIARWFPR